MSARSSPPAWLLILSRAVLRFGVPPARVDEYLGDISELWAARCRAGRRLPALRTLRDIVSLPWHAQRSPGPRRTVGSFWFQGLGTVGQDIRYAFRLMRRQPVFSILTLVTLALGIAAGTSIFTTVDRLLWRPLPFPNSQQLVIVLDPPYSFGSGRMNLSAKASTLDVFDGIGLFAEGGVNVDGLDTPVRATASVASPGFFVALGVQPVLGRAYTLEEDVAGANSVAVISHRFWHQHFGGSADVLTTPFYINRRAFTVTGVMPSGFSFPGTTDVWIPSGADNQATGQVFAPQVMARLRDGVTWDEADAALTSLDRERGAPESDRTGPRFIGLQDRMAEGVRPTLLLLAVSVGLVLLVATTNVAGLFLARVSRRRSEFVLRLALGSGRPRLLQLIVTEAMCYAALAGAAGVLLSVFLLRTLAALDGQRWTTPDTIAVDGRLLLIALLVSGTCAILFSLVPGVVAGSQPASQALRGSVTTTSGRRWRWVRHTLVIGQVAGALVLLTVTTATTDTLRRLANVDLGFDGRGVLGIDLTLPLNAYRDPQASALFASQIIDRVSGVPGVVAVGATGRLPGDRSMAAGGRAKVIGQGEDTSGQSVSYTELLASPDYFKTMGVPLLEGRPFDDADRTGSTDVVIISAGAARALWPDGRSPVGLRINNGRRTQSIQEVVGVVADVQLGGPRGTGRTSHIYYPLAQNPPYGSLSFAIKTAGDPLQAAASVRAAIQEIDPSLPIYNVRSMDRVARNFLASQRLAMSIMGGFALLTLMLAGVGLYGVLAQLIEQQTQEIGIRVALGANPQRIRWTVTAVALRLAVVGIVIGAAGSGVAARLVAAYVPHLDAVAWTTVVVHAGVLLTIALVASWVPARRASAIDPIRALRGA